MNKCFERTIKTEWKPKPSEKERRTNQIIWTVIKPSTDCVYIWLCNWKPLCKSYYLKVSSAMVQRIFTPSKKERKIKVWVMLRVGCDGKKIFGVEQQSVLIVYELPSKHHTLTKTQAFVRFFYLSKHQNHLYSFISWLGAKKIGCIIRADMQ